MKNIYQNILASKQANQKLLAILIDPDKTKAEEIENLSQKINQINLEDKKNLWL